MKDTHFGRLACAFVVLYAALLGLHTLNDFDLGWQLASGRYWVQTGHLLRQDVFSYTAPGAPWIYPQLSGLIFYAVFRLGGYTLLSLLCPLASAGVILLLVRKGGVLRAWVVLLGVPAIVWRSNVRADLFTTVLLAVFMAMLAPYLAGLKSGGGLKPTLRLWLLPLLMLAWVNLHPGFIIGLGLVFLFTLRSPKKLAPWAGLTLLATLLNPWGWRAYAAVFEQSRALSYQAAFIGEWASTPVSWQAASDAFRLRGTDGSYWLLLAVAAVAVGIALWRRKYFGALLVVATAAASLRYWRFQALFAIAAAVIVPDLLEGLPTSQSRRDAGGPRALTATATVVLGLLVLVRVTDLLSGRYYLVQSEQVTFGVGLSPWFPERAMRFVEENKLPPELYHDYNLGGYLTWRGYPAYRVFIDGRALPYGPELYFLQKRLAQLGPESMEWQQAFDRWKIHTLIVSTARNSGYGGFPLKQFCESSRFRLVYLAQDAAVLVENGPASLPVLDCRTFKLPAPPATASDKDRFRFLANAGMLYFMLERQAEAEEALRQATQLFDDDPLSHMALGILIYGTRPEEAERELRRAVDLAPSSATWNALAGFMMSQGRHQEAVECFRQAAARQGDPHESYFFMGQAYLSLKKPQEALQAFDQALDSNPYQGPAEYLGRAFEAQVQKARARALSMAGRGDEARRALSRARKLEGVEK